MSRRILQLSLICLFAWSAPTRAQHVYKCISGLDVSYQSAPCGPTQQLARQWAASPEAAPTPEQRARQLEVRAQGEHESAYLRSLARQPGKKGRPRRATGVAIAAARDGDRCAKAKKRRDDTERRLGLSRTFESMQRLSRMVSEACR